MRLTGDIEDLQRTTSILQEDKNEAEIRFEGTIQAEYVGKTLDYLTKHLIRLREERRMAAMIKLAERTRRMREAEESGQRQVELIRQQQHDLVFSQIVAVNRESVDSFLEEIISESIAYKAEEEAHEQAKESYKHRLELELESHEDEEQVLNDLVSSFVLPFVENITTRNLGERNGRPYARAAQQAIAEVLPDLERVEVETKQEELVDLPPLPKLQ